MPNSYRWHERFLTRQAIRRLVVTGSLFNVISEQTGKDLRKLLGVSQTRVHSVHLGVGEEFHPESDPVKIREVRGKYNLPEQYFLYIGSMHPRKNLPTLLKAYQLFHQTDDTGTQLVIAGRMDLGGDQLIAQIQDYGLESLVTLPGYLDEEDLPVVISEAAAMLYPSIYEGFGLPVLEAMACGTVVIASRAGSIPEVAEGFALLCDPFDVAGFADAMRRVLSDAVWCVRTTEDGLQWAKRFSWESTAVSTLGLYVELLNGLVFPRTDIGCCDAW
jgi:glycosyltransferase involved in cell wall biosynthesis